MKKYGLLLILSIVAVVFAFSEREKVSASMGPGQISWIECYNLPEGFYVSKIVPNGNAAKTELEIGNIITEVDGNKVTSLDVIKKVLNKKEKGDIVTLKVKYTSRNEYKEKEIKVTLN